MQYQMIGQGDPLLSCGKPQAYHTFFDGTRVHGPEQCNRRECPICCDERYIKTKAQDIVSNIYGWIADLLSQSRLYDKNGRSLKIYSFKFSRCENDDNIKKARKYARDNLKECGLLAGVSIVHPFRGDHPPRASPLECRQAMDTTTPSIHIHGLAIGYWTTSSKEHYIEFNKIEDIRTWENTQQPILCRTNMLKLLQYQLGHSGWVGENGQCISTWGERTKKEQRGRYNPDKPEIWIKHPEYTEDGKEIWERQDVSFDAVEECKIISCDGEMPRSGNYGNSINKWYHITEVQKEERHANWKPWRDTISGVIRYLMFHPS